MTEPDETQAGDEQIETTTVEVETPAKDETTVEVAGSDVEDAPED